MYMNCNIECSMLATYSSCYIILMPLLAFLPHYIAQCNGDEDGDGDAHPNAHPDNLLINATVVSTCK
ncbi:hypothetical protein C0J52_20691 [Blattella germanica]|nr:hypothetical protein C0J52_20691 [Blattella germanica]